MKLITTSDGSHSVFSEKFGSAYHSTHGAIQESQHVFVKSGLQFFLQSSPLLGRGLRGEALRIFEMGFGTGLNAFLTFLEMQDKNKNIEYTAAEAFPLSEELYASLNYAAFIHEEKHQPDFLAMHKCEWNSFCNISPNFALKKLNTQLESMITDCKFHLVFFDAFDPVAQPELWTEDIFRKLFNAMEEGGILVTYSSKGQVRRNMTAAGFEAERIPGPLGKREILRAIKPLSLPA